VLQIAEPVNGFGDGTGKQGIIQNQGLQISQIQQNVKGSADEVVAGDLQPFQVQK
jgi:hypothetical protein